MQNHEKTCTNCGHFVRHYRKLYSFYAAVHCGSCEKRNLTAKEKRSFPSITDCCEWIPMEEQLEKRRTDICEMLQTLTNRIDIIANILLDDEKVRKTLRK